MRLSKASALGGALGRGGTAGIKTHRIKLRQCYCDAVLSGEKRAELRINDRDYQKGDYIDYVVLSIREEVLNG